MILLIDCEKISITLDFKKNMEYNIKIKRELV